MPDLKAPLSIALPPIPAMSLNEVGDYIKTRLQSGEWWCIASASNREHPQHPLVAAVKAVARDPACPENMTHLIFTPGIGPDDPMMTLLLVHRSRLTLEGLHHLLTIHCADRALPTLEKMAQNEEGDPTIYCALPSSHPLTLGLAKFIDELFNGVAELDAASAAELALLQKPRSTLYA